MCALVFASALAPSWALAQESEAEGEGEPRYEPDQRGAEGDESGGEGEPQYEPDQRGAQQPEPRYEPDQRGATEEDVTVATEQASYAPASAGDSEYATSGGSGMGVDLVLSLGGAISALDAAGQGNLVSASQEGSFGASLGFNAMFRIGRVAFGPRVSMILDPSFVLANLGIGAQVMLTEDAIAPYVSASIGGTIVTGLGDALPSQETAGIFGVGAELGGGVRWHATREVIVGAELGAGWHHLWRDAVPSCTTDCTGSELDLRTSGESDALTLRLSLYAGYSF
jgi:hypothetical protein